MSSCYQLILHTVVVPERLAEFGGSCPGAPGSPLNFQLVLHAVLVLGVRLSRNVSWDRSSPGVLRSSSSTSVSSVASHGCVSLAHCMAWPWCMGSSGPRRAVCVCSEILSPLSGLLLFLCIHRSFLWLMRLRFASAPCRFGTCSVHVPVNKRHGELIITKAADNLGMEIERNALGRKHIASAHGTVIDTIRLDIILDGLRHRRIDSQPSVSS